MKQTGRPAFLPAPVKGLNTLDPPENFPAACALQLENVIPRSSKMQLRAGNAVWVESGFATPVFKTIIPYNNAWGSSKLFAAADTGVYDVTASGALGGLVTPLTNGRVQYTTIGRPADQALCLVNGTDSFKYYNGAAWTTVANFTLGVGTIATTNFIGIATYQSRLFFIHATDPAFYYCTTAGAVPGTVARYPVDGLFTKGGKLMAIGTWTVDGGAGPGDYCVFISSEGEAAVFTGGDPGDANNWALKGVYQIGRPLGRRCLLKYGGDLLVLTDLGLQPMSKALQSSTIDRSINLTNLISPTFIDLANQYFSTDGWQVELLTQQQLLLILVPSVPVQILAMDTTSKAWCILTGDPVANLPNTPTTTYTLDFTCLGVFGGQLFAGGFPGKVINALVGTADYGQPINGKMLLAPAYFKVRDVMKWPTMIRPNFTSTGFFNVSYGAAIDYGPVENIYTLAAFAVSGTRWDVGLWDVDAWTADLFRVHDWRTVPAKVGFAYSLYIGISTAFASVYLTSVNVILQDAGLQG